MTVQEFEYTHELKFDKQQYVDAYMEFFRVTRPLKLAVAYIIATTMLFWTYTLIIGICYISCGLLVRLLVPRTMPGYMIKRFKADRFNRQETTYAVDQNGYAITAEGLKIAISWDNTMAWRQSSNWLQIQTGGFPNALFRVRELKQAGVYDQLMTTFRSHGIKRK